jgi:hypothetical protein
MRRSSLLWITQLCEVQTFAFVDEEWARRLSAASAQGNPSNAIFSWFAPEGKYKKR